ncbi:hypothetical protein DRO29_07325 [Candidatus Bathyarchaeota archaeon]|nr:MAG: hypothetical protein DRO29_07325 [Candidatus Bathyarchaeota archaeon]
MRFKNICMRLKKREYYENCDDQSKVMVGKGSYDSLEELLRDMEEIKKQIRDQLGFPHETQK